MNPKIHIHLHTTNLEQARSFYQALLGTAPTKDKPGYLKFLPDFAPLNLAITPAEKNTGSAHYGVQLNSPDDVRTHLDRVKKAGLPVREEMGVDCCHANQDKFWVTDPEGNEWELYHLNFDIDVEGKDNTGQGCCPAEGQSNVQTPDGFK